MSPCAGVNTLAALLAGASDEPSLRRLEGHLDVCASCRQLVADLGQGLSSLGEHRPAPRARPLRLPRLGERVDRYTLRRLLGVGGMGVVFEAHDPTLGRKVALKLVRPDVLDDPSPLSLLDEARAMARVQHANVVAVYDAGMFADQLYVCMEYVPGTTLRAWIAARPRSTREILAAFVAAGTGLVHIHRAGLVHLDFKPDNVLVAATGRFLVSDFGLTRMVRGPRGALGRVAGTPAYMAPEQKRGAPTDACADQYSFSTALREALGARAPRWLARVIARGMAEDPSRRYPSMDALLNALVRDRRERAGHRSVATVAVLAASVLVATRPQEPVERIIDRTDRTDRTVDRTVDHPVAAPALPALDAPWPAATAAPTTAAARSASAAGRVAHHRSVEDPRRSPVPAEIVHAGPAVIAPMVVEPTAGCDDDTALTCEMDPPRCAAGAIAAIRAGCWTCTDELTCRPLPGSGTRSVAPGGALGLIAVLGPTTWTPGAGPASAGSPAPGAGAAPGAGGGTGSPGSGSGDASVCDCSNGGGGTSSSDCGCSPGSTDCSCGTASGSGSAGNAGDMGTPTSGGGRGTGTASGSGDTGGTGSGSSCSCDGGTTGTGGGSTGTPTTGTGGAGTGTDTAGGAGTGTGTAGGDGTGTGTAGGAGTGGDGTGTGTAGGAGTGGTGTGTGTAGGAGTGGTGTGTGTAGGAGTGGTGTGTGTAGGAGTGSFAHR